MTVESKHVAPLSHYIFNITTVVFDGPSPPFTSDNTDNLERLDLHLNCLYTDYLMIFDRL